MKPSTKLQSQLDRLKKVGAFSIGQTEKKELQELTEKFGLPEYNNLSCGTCTRTAMHNLNSYLNRKENTPVLTLGKTTNTDTINFEGVKKPNEMNYQELRKACKAKGIKTGKNPKKEQLIKLLSND